MQAAGSNLLATSTNSHEQRAAHMQHLASGLQLRASDLDALGQQCQDEGRAARELQRTVAPRQAKLAAGAPIAILRRIVIEKCRRWRGRVELGIL